jgi:hypothetical protein
MFGIHGTAHPPMVSNSIRMSPVAGKFAKIARFLSEASRSRLAWLIVFLHAAWFLLAVANMHPPSRDFAQFLEHNAGSTVAILEGRPFHYSYESWSMQILFLLDLPSSLASIPLAILFLPFSKIFRLGLYEGSYVGAGITLAMSSLQWLAIGYRADKWLGSKLWGQSLLQRIHRLFAVLIILVLLLTAIWVPIVNTRSRQLASRHAIL